MALFGADLDPSLNVPTKQSTFAYWLQWYKELRSVVSKETANSLFNIAWQERKPDNFSSSFDYTNQKQLIDYLKKNDLIIDNNGAITVVEGAKKFFGFITDPFGITGIAKWVVIFLAVMVGIIIISLVISFTRNPGKYAQLATFRGMK